MAHPRNPSDSVRLAGSGAVASTAMSTTGYPPGFGKNVAMEKIIFPLKHLFLLGISQPATMTGDTPTNITPSVYNSFTMYIRFPWIFA